MLVFLSVIEKIADILWDFFVVFARARSFYSQPQSSRRAEKNFYNARSLQENLARSAANQSARTIVAM